jgi:hypothetical protein
MTIRPQWSTETHCYLCGLSHEDNGPTNRDHVPPRRIFPRQIRINLRADLLTLRTHVACQSAYAADEEYFFNTLLPNALESSVGPMLAEDFKHLIAHDKVAKKLSETVRRQFEDRPSGLVLPRGMVVQRVTGSRLQRIVWKIVRGLFAIEYERFLPEDTPRHIDIIGPLDRDVPDYVKPMIGRPRKGHTLSCFGYSILHSSEIPDWAEPFPLHVFLIELWERFALAVAFHDPSCGCTKCS